MGNVNLNFIQNLHLQQKKGWIKNYSTFKSVDWLNGLINILFPEDVTEIEEIVKSFELSKAQFYTLLKDTNLSEIRDAEITAQNF